ncbi:energy transducer TonB family protein [Mangrovibacterium lignilyticum]|uniref:energy transducer TonB family protein n=1 Tax=Mangrovibacterium lignilyticum TaxID=2668052 RepID=UPI0013D38380|nr:energy transducer TonB [Mangrovibacterium lignilyticum]
MQRIKKLYHDNIYGIIGTLAFHVLLFVAILLANVKIEGEVKEEEIIIDFSSIEELPEIEKVEKPMQEDENTPSASLDNPSASMSNRAVNDAAQKDPFFDEDYQREIAEAQKLVTNVNKQLSKEIPEMKKFEMPEQTTEGMDPEKISNTVYSGESNIHYNLENRYHVRLPIPVYLAKGGGKITVDIWVSPSGKVIKAQLQPHAQISDPMLPEYALQAALRTVFDAKADSPSPQKGTISYTFVAQ